ncbi:MAG: hypothetical protein M3R00_08050 [Pseudomonadota bacterium]|nr:hypothetical protein [Pseudomonadota bacterium]
MQQQTEETAILVIYDHDLTNTMQHTQGNMVQRAFETPYVANLRMFTNLREHIQQKLNSHHPRIILGCATFGENRQRIVQSYAALGVDEQSVLICAKFIRKRLAALQGKNEHIVNILQQHYARNPHIKITHVILCDDDQRNIARLDNYTNFIQSHELLKSDARFQITVAGILVPKPVMLMEDFHTDSGLPYSKLARRFDENLDIEVFCETAESEHQFLACLKSINEKIAEITAQQLLKNQSDHTLLQLPKPRKRINPLSRSLDEAAIQQQVKEAAKHLARFNFSGNVSPVTENSSSIEHQKLFKSGP